MAKHHTSLYVDDKLEVFVRRRAEDGNDEIQLVDVVLAREQRSTVEHLGQNAAHLMKIIFQSEAAREHDRTRSFYLYYNALRHCVM